MKRKITYSLLLLALNYFNTQAQSNTIVWSDTFEDVGAPLSGTRLAENNSGFNITSNSTNPPFEAYFIRTNGSNIHTIFSASGYTGFEGTKYWAGENHDEITGVVVAANAEQQIDWTGINVSGKINLGFRGLFAANNVNGAFESFTATGGASQSDYIIVEYRFNGTGAYTQLLRFYSNNNLTGANNKSLALETTGDEQGDGTILSTTLSQFEKIIPGSGNTLDLRIRCSTNGGNEEWAVDNFRLVENFLSKDEFESTKEISVYPNPAENSFKIQTATAGDFSLVNQLGQTIKSFHTEANMENNIDVSNLTNGIYFIKGEKGTTINTKKIVVKN